MNYLKIILYLTLFPGFVFTAVAGMIASSVDRKVTARVQWRKGPPVLQPFYDFVKYLGKETIVPAGASRFTFLVSPLIGLSAVTVVSTIVWLTMLTAQKSFAGDFIVVVYLLTVPALSVIMGGFSSGNPLSSLGASREMKLILAYELPFISSLLVPVIKCGSIRLGDIISAPASAGSLSGMIALAVAVICMQAKLGLVPFDAAEAEQEIVAGPYTEYSGTPLAIFRLTRHMMLFVLPMFLAVMFMPPRSIIDGAVKYVVLLVLIILIRNTNPRLRIDQAVNFFWKLPAVLAAVAIILALNGL
jgi:NADH-quinone oxidoreductase subunit H